MIARLSVTALLGLGMLAAAGAADPPKPPAASLREAVYFGPAGPVRIRLHVSIDGRAADAIWADAINALFAHGDRDGDGFLDASERTPFVQQPRKGRDVVLVIDGPAPLQPLLLTFNQKDEKVSRTAFAEAVKTAGVGAIGLRVVPVGANSPQLSAALFRHIDRSGDGRLSVEELKAAREPLAALDLDEDEFITATELLGRGVAANAGRVRPVFPGMREPDPPADTSKDLVFLTADGAQGVKQLLAARGGAKATALKPAEFGGNAKAFAALDQDGNGLLDTTELTAWLGRPADLELTVSFDSSGGRLTPPAAHPVEKNGALAAALPGGRFRFEPPAGTPAKDWKQAADALAALFKELGKSGSVERKQVEGQPPALAFFDVADRNADGKVDAAEVESALKALAPLAACRADVAFVDRGDGLFELLDRNNDGRLSPRELVESIAVLKPFAGADGSVGPKDLVRQFQVLLAAEPIPVGVLFNPSRPPAEATRPPVTSPGWFTKMDRNADGEVSLREFLGPIELFRKLDRDNDGLLSPSEVNAAGK